MTYISVEPDNLLLACSDMLQRSSDKLNLVLNGTIPLQDRQSFRDRFNKQFVGFSDHPLHLESWSEYFTLAVAAKYYDFSWRNVQIVTDEGNVPVHYKAAIGLEERFTHDSSVREFLLGDGIILNPFLKTGITVQECKAQNVRGKSKGKNLEDEIIRVIKAKTTQREKYPDECALLVTAIPNEEALGANHINVTNILRECPEVTLYDPVLLLLYRSDFRSITVAPLDPTIDTSENFREACLIINIRESSEIRA